MCHVQIRYPDIYVGYGSGPADSICMIVLKTSPFITPTGEAFGPTSSMDGQTHLHTQWAFSSPHFKTCASWRLKEASWRLEMLPFGIISSLAQSWRICRIWKRTTLIIPGSGLPDSTSTRPLRPGLKCHNSSHDVQNFHGPFTARAHDCPLNHSTLSTGLYIVWLDTSRNKIQTGSWYLLACLFQ